MKRVLALSAITVAVGCASGPEPTTAFRYAEKRARLSNGARLVVIPDRSTPLVQVDVRYEVGSAEDPPGKAGLAHLAEHLMFQHRMLGPDRPATFDLLPQIALGFNAYTTYDETHYELVASKEDVEALLRVEAFRMDARCRTIPPAEFEREREVVRNELRTRAGSPEGLMPRLVSEAVYPAGHPYRHTTGGDDQQLAAITFEDACRFLERYYTPDRATVIVTGNVDPDEVGRKFAFLFGGIARREAAPRAVVPPIALSARRTEHRLDIDRPLLWVLWRMPPATSPDFAKADGLAVFARRLDRLAETWEFASNVASFRFGGKLAPTLALLVELPPGGDVDEALEYVWKATATGHWGFGDEDFFEKVTKNRLRMAFVESIERLGARAELVADAIQFPSGRVDFGASGKEYLIDEMHEIDGLSAGSYRDFVRRTLDRDRAQVVVFRPARDGARGDRRADLSFSPAGHDEAPEPLVDPAEAGRPLPAPRTSSILPRARRYTLDNGMAVVLLAYDGLPIVHAELVVGAGHAGEPADRAGLAEVAARFLQPPPGANFQLWVSTGAAVDADQARFAARGLSTYTDVVIESLERTVATGDYDQKRLEAHQLRVRRELGSPARRQREAFERALGAAEYGDRHPYAWGGAPTAASIGRIGHDAAAAFKRGRYVASNATLVVVGNFDEAAARATIGRTFGGWARGAAAPRPPERAGAAGAAQAIGVVGDDHPQMRLAVSYPAPSGRDGQHAARLILAEMLDQEMAAIRTRLGSTYGTYAEKTDHLGPNAYRMGGQVDAARAGESLREVRRRIDGLRRGDDLARRFALARRQVLRRLVAESTETAVMAERLASMAAFGQGPADEDGLIRRVAAASPAQVRALMAEELRPDREIVVCLADRATLVRAFREAGIARPRWVEPE
jgi:zinc protease